LQQNPELLVVTLVSTLPEREADVLAHIRLIGEMMRNATGLVSSYFYRGREPQPCYVFLNTWEDEESWQRAQERYNLITLLLTRPELLARPPEQWYMYYRWGYSRPARPQTVATTLLATLPADTFDATYTAWLQELRKEARQFTFTFSFLASGIATTQHERNTEKALKDPINMDLVKQGCVLLTFIGWSSEAERLAFYGSKTYQRISSMLEQHSSTCLLTLDQP
jgi:hypothetical protein